MGSGSDAPEFEVSAGPVAMSSPMSPTTSPPTTWLSPNRIVDEPAVPSPGAPQQVRASIPAPTTSAPATTSTTRVAPTPTTVVVNATTVVRAPPTTVAPRPTTTIAPRPTTTIARTTTTTQLSLALPALGPVTPAAKPYARSDQGLASWYNAPDRTCAHRTIPKGVIIKVTRTSTGESVTCEVADWGPADMTRVIDLSMDTFELLAHAGAGLMEVRIEW